MFEKECSLLTCFYSIELPEFLALMKGLFFQGAEPRGDKDVEVWSSSSADTSDSGHGGSELDVSAVKVICINLAITDWCVAFQMFRHFGSGS